jgi:hypothetical protein
MVEWRPYRASLVACSRRLASWMRGHRANSCGLRVPLPGSAACHVIAYRGGGRRRDGWLRSSYKRGATVKPATRSIRLPGLFRLPHPGHRPREPRAGTRTVRGRAAAPPRSGCLIAAIIGISLSFSRLVASPTAGCAPASGTGLASDAGGRPWTLSVRCGVVVFAATAGWPGEMTEPRAWQDQTSDMRRRGALASTVWATFTWLRQIARSSHALNEPRAHTPGRGRRA